MRNLSFWLRFLAHFDEFSGASCQEPVAGVTVISVKSLRRVVSILLLSVFGLLLVTESLTASTHQTSCENEAIHSAGEQGPVAQLLCDDPHASDQHEKCTDPCHVGLCHIGHCSFVSNQTDVQMSHANLASVVSGFSQTAVEGPVLEGLRRPPRLL